MRGVACRLRDTGKIRVMEITDPSKTLCFFLFYWVLTGGWIGRRGGCLTSVSGTELDCRCDMLRGIWICNLEALCLSQGHHTHYIQTEVLEKYFKFHLVNSNIIWDICYNFLKTYLNSFSQHIIMHLYALLVVRVTPHWEGKGTGFGNCYNSSMRGFLHEGHLKVP